MTTATDSTTSTHDEQPLAQRRSRTIGEPAQSPGIERGSVEIELGPEMADGRPTPAGWRWIGRKLREEMPSRTFKGKGNVQMRFVSARQVQKRLDDIVGPGHWATKVHVVRAEPPVAVQVGIAIFDVWKEDIGYSNQPGVTDEFIEQLDQSGQRVIDQATGEVRMRRNPGFEEEPLKAATSDAFKRAAVLWGVGRWLYPDANL